MNGRWCVEMYVNVLEGKYKRGYVRPLYPLTFVALLPGGVAVDLPFPNEEKFCVTSYPIGWWSVQKHNSVHQPLFRSHSWQFNKYLIHTYISTESLASELSCHLIWVSSIHAHQVSFLFITEFIMIVGAINDVNIIPLRRLCAFWKSFVWDGYKPIWWSRPLASLYYHPHLQPHPQQLVSRLWISLPQFTAPVRLPLFLFALHGLL